MPPTPCSKLPKAMASEENAGIHDLVINAKSKKDNSTIYNHGTDYLP